MNIYQNRTSKITVTLYESDRVTPRDLTGLTGEFHYGNKETNQAIGTGSVAITTPLQGEVAITVDGTQLTSLTPEDFGITVRKYSPEEVAYGHLMLLDGTSIADVIYFDIKVFFEL